MGSRSRYVAGSVALGALVAARRRARLRRAAEGVREAILPSHVIDLPYEERIADEAHAPGHQHLEAPSDRPIPRRARLGRPEAHPRSDQR